MSDQMQEIINWFSGAFGADGEIRHDWQRIDGNIRWIMVPIGWIENAPIPIKHPVDEKKFNPEDMLLTTEKTSKEILSTLQRIEKLIKEQSERMNII